MPPGPPAFVNSSGGVTTAVRDANGGLIRELPVGGDACSPDATRLITRSSAGAQTLAAISNLDGSPVRAITVPVANAQPGAITWSPDAARLAVAYFASGTTGIFLMNADGSGATQLPNAAPTGSALSWSPDGAELLFTTGQSTLRSFTIASGATRDIATNVFQARWSPDGNYIGIVEWFLGTSNWPISVMNRDGTGRRLVTTITGSAPSFTWTPDGRMLYGDNGTLTFLNVNTGSKTPLAVSEAGHHSAPHWCGTP